MKNFFRSIRTFVTAMPHFLMFELLYKLILSAAGAPLLSAVFNFTISSTGVGYLTDENMIVYLKSPVTIVFIVLLLFCLGFFAFVELSALAACFSCIHMKETITVGGMLRTGLKSFKKAFRGMGVLRFLLFMIFMPLAQFTLSAGMFIAPLMPVLRRIFSSISRDLPFAAYAVIQLLFIVFIVGKCYTLHYMTLTNSSFSESVKKSSEKIRKNKAKTTLQFLLWSVFILAFIAAVIFGAAFFIVLLIKGFSKTETAFYSALSVLRYAMKIFSAVAVFFSAPAIMCWITGKFFAELDNEEKKQIKVPDSEREKMKKVPKAILIATLSATGLVVNAFYIIGIYKGNIKLNGFITGTQITAHRGFSYNAPENTKYAFKAAIDSDADYIELDVQLTADGELAVIHDKTLDRTTNGTGLVSDYTYAELSQLCADNGFGGEFSDAKIMLLSDVLEFIGHKCMLNIEIKNIGDVNTTVDKTVEVIKKYKFEGSCYITSFSYSALQRVKSIEPKIKTALITNLAASSGYSQIPDVDAVSMNFIFVNKSVVDTAHQDGKLIFVWTVDRDEDIRKMMALGVDNIITNRPDKAAAIINSDDLADVILYILQAMFSS